MKHLTAAAAILVAVAGVARADKIMVPFEDHEVDPKIPFEKYTLANGLEVVLVRDPAVPIVAVDVWYHVGSGVEQVGKSGFAHLFEHMLFQGSKNVGEDKHFEILKKLGASDVNGTTNPDRTNYYEVVPSNQLETALWLESDRMSHLLELLTADSLKNQIDVVRNERRVNYEDVPYGAARFALFAALYPEGHPYRYLTIGKSADIEHASVADVTAFFKTWYVPANATIAIAGDIDLPATKALVDKWFGTFPTSVKPVAVVAPMPTIKTTEVTVTDKFAKLRQLSFAWHSPAQFAPGDAELDVIAEALGADGTGRLYKALVYDHPIATEVRVYQSGSQFSGTFRVDVTLRTGASADEAKKIVLAAIAKATTEPLDATEIQRVVAGNEMRTYRELETVFGRAQGLQMYNHYLGDPDKLTWDLDRYRHATAAGITAVAATYLRPDRMVVVTTQPAAPGAKP